MSDDKNKDVGATASDPQDGNDEGRVWIPFTPEERQRWFERTLFWADVKEVTKPFSVVILPLLLLTGVIATIAAPNKTNNGIAIPEYTYTLPVVVPEPLEPKPGSEICLTRAFFDSSGAPNISTVFDRARVIKSEELTVTVAKKYAYPWSKLPTHIITVQPDLPSDFVPVQEKLIRSGVLTIGAVGESYDCDMVDYSHLSPDFEAVWEPVATMTYNQMGIEARPTVK